MNDNNVKITTDSISDLGKALRDKHDIGFFPLMITLGEESVFDSDDLQQKIFDYVEKSGKTPKTAARGVEEYIEFFKENLPCDGSLVHFTIASGMSASYANALAASKQLENVYVVDSTSLSTGAGLTVLYACDLKNSGLDAKTIAEKCVKKAKDAQASFVVDSLEYLYKGGRCSSVQLLFSNILKIKPMIMVKDGKMVVGKKYISRFEKSVDKYVDDILDLYNKPDLTRAFITYTTCDDEILNAVKEKVLARYPFKELHLTQAAGTVTCHCGKNTLGVLYFNETE